LVQHPEETLTQLASIREQAEALLANREGDCLLDRGDLNKEPLLVRQTYQATQPGESLTLTTFERCSWTLWGEGAVQFALLDRWTRSVEAVWLGGHGRWRTSHQQGQTLVQLQGHKMVLGPQSDIHVMGLSGGNVQLVPMEGYLLLANQQRIGFGQALVTKGRELSIISMASAPVMTKPQNGAIVQLDRDGAPVLFLLEGVQERDQLLFRGFGSLGDLQPEWERTAVGAAPQLTLPPGAFHVTAWIRHASGVLSYPSAPLSLTLSVKGASSSHGPPLKDVQLQVVGDVVIVTGKTAPHVAVFVNERSIQAGADGRFELVFTLTRRGENTLSIAAIASDGSKTTLHKKVMAEF
jgi:hypothetical protein